MIEFVSKWWCRWAHQKVYRPVKGYYRCSTCLRAWPVPWEAGPRERAAEAGARDQYVAAGA
ncbi:MAG TPA: hypothetical protein VFA28_02625 [Bryobacteraceae bacterium]|jgi:hypothetical protein|nr:hypothetical protein [Bryobacteraceae bacterium]